jgi:isocitrate lyase
MDDEAMRRFPDDLGRLGFVFTFITYGGHQIDGLAAEEFSAAVRRDGMLALARLQRRLRLLDSPYRTPQSLVGGPRGDAALMAATGRTASTRAMGAASTHGQHLVPIEPAPSVLEAGLRELGRPDHRVTLWPATPWSDRTDLTITDADGATCLVLTWQVVDGSPGEAPGLVVRVDGPGATDDELVAAAVAYVEDRTGVTCAERRASASVPEAAALAV